MCMYIYICFINIYAYIYLYIFYIIFIFFIYILLYIYIYIIYIYIYTCTYIHICIYHIHFDLRFFGFMKNVGLSGIWIHNVVLTVHTLYPAEPAGDETCLAQSSSTGSSGQSLTLRIFSFKPSLRANFTLLPLSVATIIFPNFILLEVNHEFVAESSGIYDINFELKLFRSIRKVGLNGIWTKNIVLIVHTL